MTITRLGGGAITLAEEWNSSMYTNNLTFNASALILQSRFVSDNVSGSFGRNVRGQKNLRIQRKTGSAFFLSQRQRLNEIVAGGVEPIVNNKPNISSFSQSLAFPSFKIDNNDFGRSIGPALDFDLRLIPTPKVELNIDLESDEYTAVPSFPLYAEDNTQLNTLEPAVDEE